MYKISRLALLFSFTLFSVCNGDANQDNKEISILLADKTSIERNRQAAQARIDNLERRIQQCKKEIKDLEYAKEGVRIERDIFSAASKAKDKEIANLQQLHKDRQLAESQRRYAKNAEEAKAREIDGEMHLLKQRMDNEIRRRQQMEAEMMQSRYNGARCSLIEETTCLMRTDLLDVLICIILILGGILLASFGPELLEYFGDHKGTAFMVFALIGTGVIALVIKICDG